MRHRNGTVRLGRKSKHRELMFANLLSSLFTHGRIRTTLAKAKAARPLAERLVTLAKKGTIHHRRLATSRLRNEGAVAKLFKEIAPIQAERQGGYTRIIKLENRIGDAAPMAFLEIVKEGAGSIGEVDELKALEKKMKTNAKKKSSVKGLEPKTVDAEAEVVEKKEKE
ncbi:MAG: 50S ribosomal protein L17 [Verrucomicrobiota bacterium]|nr:50S ribosomal protein L17 [Verrucomicrobiota bacterium]